MDRPTQHRRRLRLAGTLVGSSLRLGAGAAGRRRRQVCRAAGVLTALGVRVVVLRPPAPWPRSGYAVVPDAGGWLADLALVTVARGAPVLRGDVPPGTTACPVTVRYRDAGGELSAERVPRTVRDVAAARDLVVEVRLQSPES